MFKFIFLTLLIFAPRALIYGQSTGPIKGVDFRMQLVSGNLDFTSISGIKRPFKGVGSELLTSLYLLERTRFRMSLFIASRVMSWSGQNVLDSEYDDLQTFSVAPGLELQYGALYVSAASQQMNVNAYNISTASKGNQFIIKGLSTSAGLNFRFNNLGIGIGVIKMNVPVSAETTGLSTSSQYVETSYTLNLSYYIGLTPGKFFRNLFVK